MGKYGFGAKTRCAKVLANKDLKGKHFVITGTSIGSIGYATALSLFNANAEVSLLNRNEEKMKLTKEAIEKQAPENCKGKINMFKCDLSQQSSVKNCVNDVIKFLNGKKIYCLICNAGLVVNEKRTTVDGWEHTFAVCHLAHFTLTLGLLPHIADNGRIVMLSSLANSYGKIDFEDLHFEKRKYGSQKAYSQSKLSNIMFSNELNRRLRASGKKITCNSVHPGGVWSNFVDKVPVILKFTMIALLFPFLKNIDQGASTSVFVAVDERLEGKGGLYFSDCTDKNYNKLAKDKELTKKLFDISEDLCKIKYPF